MKEDKVAQLKKNWLKGKRIPIAFIVLIVAALFVCSLFFHNVLLVVLGVIIGFSSIFYYKNKLSAYVENELYKK